MTRTMAKTTFLICVAIIIFSGMEICRYLDRWGRSYCPEKCTYEGTAYPATDHCHYDVCQRISGNYQ